MTVDPTWLLLALLKVYGWALLILAACCIGGAFLAWLVRDSFPAPRDPPPR
jgi:hypothetical protein